MDFTDDYTRLRPYLNAGERVRWVGRPVRANPLTKGDIILIPIGALWCGDIVSAQLDFWTEKGFLFFKAMSQQMVDF